jgi:formylglycine-generating enzyme required for sulfatase activity
MVSHIIYSDDGGETWAIGGSVPRDKTTECTAVELSDGDLMLNSRNQNDRENHRVVAISKDGGATFSQARLDTALIEPRGCQGSLLFHSLNPRTGKGNILFSNPDSASSRSDGTLKLSEDDGRTWTKAFRYAPEPAPYFTGYSDIALLPGGDIGVLYERGEFRDGDPKAERYAEMGFTVVTFDEIRSPPASPRPGIPPAGLPASASGAAGPAGRPGDEMRVELPGGLALRFVWVPPGRFVMGAPAGEPDREIDEAQHEVTLTRGFWLGKFEVSNREFRAFRPGHRSWGMQGEKGEFDGDDQPAVCLDAADADAFCRWAAAGTGRPIRLPTEAEWEYACRAGSTGAYCFGDDRSLLGQYAWIAANSDGHTHPVGRKKPNAWGLHDMHGNVAEWVNDLYAYYPGGPQTDPRGPERSGHHAWRECSWSSQPFECRCATRDYSEPGYKSAALGLRVACDAEPSGDGAPPGVEPGRSGQE